MAPNHRVSYVIPPPSYPVPTLSLPPPGLPRNGQTAPILIPSPHQPQQHIPSRNVPSHRLPVSALALDTTTLSANNEDKDTPGGILYSGGRDGMLIAWDLHLPMKPRESRYGFHSAFSRGGGRGGSGGRNRRVGRWDVLTRDEDDENAIYEEEDDDHWPTSDGDVLGDVPNSAGRRTERFLFASGGEDGIPFEQRWEVDGDGDVDEAGQHPTVYRQGVQAHSDWVNDILLCNQNQTVVSASSDGTVKAWNPHQNIPPSTLGVHSDYVRCLAISRERNWIASGSFDRTVKLWDITRTQDSSPSSPSYSPLVTLQPPDSPSPKSSIYTLSTDPFGHLLATGGPERVVRLWDPRSGKRTGKLVGHTDNIRAMCMSEDSRYLLTGSADASIKLWSLLSPQRCLHTFTHHTESVWSLFSAHPSLEIFYSGDRAGLVCRVDVEAWGRGEECDHVSEGECVVLCRDQANLAGPAGTGTGTGAGTGTGEGEGEGEGGISKLVAADDTFLWTAGGSSSIHRWRIPPGRAQRLPVPSRPFSANSGAGPDSPTSNSDIGSTFSLQLQIQDPLGMVPLTPASATFHEFSPASATATATARRRAKGHSITPSFVSSVSSLTPPEIEIDFDGVGVGGGGGDGVSGVAGDNSGGAGQGGIGGQGGEGAETRDGIPYASMVRLSAPNGVRPPQLNLNLNLNLKRGTGREADVSTLYSAASFVSVPGSRVYTQSQTHRGAGAGTSAGVGQRAPTPSPTRTSFINHAHSQSVTSKRSTLSPPGFDNLSPTSITSPSHAHGYGNAGHAGHGGHGGHAGYGGRPLSLQLPLPPLHLPSPRAAYFDRDVAPDATPLCPYPDSVVPPASGSNTAAGEGFSASGVIHGLVRVLMLNDRVHALTVDSAGVVAAWDVVRAYCVGVFGVGEVRRACVGDSDSSEHEDPSPSFNNNNNTTSTNHNNTNNANNDYPHLHDPNAKADANTCARTPRISPRQALETVRERVEGEAVVLPWATADTRIGELTVHLMDGGRCFEAEVFADEVGVGVGGGGGGIGGGIGGGGEKVGEDVRLNIGKWILRNLFLGFIREEQRSLSLRQGHSHVHGHGHGHGHGIGHGQQQGQKGQHKGHGRTQSESAASVASASTLGSASGLGGGSPAAGGSGGALPPIPALPGTSNHHDTNSNPNLSTPGDLATPRPTAPVSASGELAQRIGGLGNHATTTPGTGVGATATPSAQQSHDYFSLRRRPSTSHSAAAAQSTTATAQTAGTGAGAGAEDDFSGWGGPASGKHEGGPSTPSTPGGGGFMNRFKFLGKNSTRRAATEVDTPSTTGLPGSAVGNSEGRSQTQTQVEEAQPQVVSSRTILLQHLKSQPFTPPSPSDAPLLHLPADTAIMVSKETPAGWLPIFRGKAADAPTGVEEMSELEEILPEWVLEYVFTGRTPAVPVMKINFVLLPAVIPPHARAEYGETLPELLNTTQSKLSASRFLRVRKLTYHVYDKLDRHHPPPSRTSTPRSSTDNSHSHHPNGHTHSTGHGHGHTRAAQGSNTGTASPPTSRSSTPRLSPNLSNSPNVNVNSSPSSNSAHGHAHAHSHTHAHGHAHAHAHAQPHLRADEMYEILCNDHVLSPEMTLAAVRQFVWRSANELVMHYRRKPRHHGTGGFASVGATAAVAGGGVGVGAGTGTLSRAGSVSTNTSTSHATSRSGTGAEPQRYAYGYI